MADGERRLKKGRPMKEIFLLIKRLSRLMYWIAAIALASIVLLQATDVILRRFRMPIDWAYEIVVLLGAIAIGFSVPQTTLNKGHVFMEFLIEKLPKGWQRVFHILTRCFGIILFAIFGWRIIAHGISLSKSGEVSPVLEIPTYPATYGIGVCCFIVCIILLNELWQTKMEAKG